MLATIVTIVLTLVAAPAANAAVRYATPTGGATSGSCAAAPCTLEVAVNSAADGDEVVVAPGTYTLTKKLTPRGELDIHGDRDHAWPRIAGPGKLKEPMLTLKGGTLEHVWLAAASNKEALILEEGIVDGVRLESANGDAATVYGSDATVIRNSVVHSAGATDSAALWLRDGSGDEQRRDPQRDRHGDRRHGERHPLRPDERQRDDRELDRARQGLRPRLHGGAAASRTRTTGPSASTGVAAGIGNQSAEPRVRRRRLPARRRLADDRRRRSSTPARARSILTGAPRMLGAAPDIGAYEYAPPATTGDAGTADARSCPTTSRASRCPSRAAAWSSPPRAAPSASASRAATASRRWSRPAAFRSARSSTRATAASASRRRSPAACRPACSGARSSRPGSAGAARA